MNIAPYAPLNNLLNRVDGWSQEFNQSEEPQGVFKRHIATRLASAVAGGTIGVAGAVKETFKTAGYGLAMPIRLPLNVFLSITGTDCLEDLDNKLPTFKEFIKQVLRIASCAIGVLSSVSLGLISPSANFRLHCALGLANNQRLEEQEIAEKQQNEAELALQGAQIKFQLQLQEEAAKAAKAAEHAKKHREIEHAKKEAEHAAKKQLEQEAAEKHKLQEAAKVASQASVHHHVDASIPVLTRASSVEESSDSGSDSDVEDNGSAASQPVRSRSNSTSSNASEKGAENHHWYHAITKHLHNPFRRESHSH